jgi:hypothetical protein
MGDTPLSPAQKREELRRVIEEAGELMKTMEEPASEPEPEPGAGEQAAPKPESGKEQTKSELVVEEESY